MLKIYNKSEYAQMKFELKYKLIKLPAGELHFRFYDLNNLSLINSILIEADLSSSDDLILLVLMADYFKCEKELKLFYTPYARQDRQTSLQEPFSFKTIAKLINSCDFSCVTVYDPHSDVMPALIENCVVRKRVDLVPKIEENYIIVSPDAGAMKANNEIAKKWGLRHIVATKVIDVKTGEITATQIHTDIDLRNQELLVLDNICDGGRTFIELAKVLKTYNPKNINLYVTVGIYSKGVEVLHPYYNTIDQFYKLGE